MLPDILSLLTLPLSISLSPYLSIPLSCYLSISLSLYLPISLSPYLSISLSLYLPKSLPKSLHIYLFLLSVLVVHRPSLPPQPSISSNHPRGAEKEGRAMVGGRQTMQVEGKQEQECGTTVPFNRGIVNT